MNYVYIKSCSSMILHERGVVYNVNSIQCSELSIIP